MKLKQDILDKGCRCRKWDCLLEVMSCGGDSEFERGCVTQKTGVKTPIKKKNSIKLIEIIAHHNLSSLLPPGAISVSDARC